MQEINITFMDETYRIPANKAFQVATEVETVATLMEMSTWRSNPRFTLIAQCVGVMLRFAGADVTDAQVHQEMMEQVKRIGKSNSKTADLFHLRAITALMALLMNGMPEDIKGDTLADPVTNTKKKKIIAAL